MRQTRQRESRVGPDYRRSRLLVCITTCERNHDRVRAIRETWLAQPVPEGVAALFVYGDGMDPAPAVVGSALTLPVRDAYECLPEKTRALFRWALEVSAFEHILKCDDDSYVHLDVLANLELDGVDYAGRLTPPVPGVVETWHYGKCSSRDAEVPFRGPFPDLFAEGFGYFVSRRAASVVAAASDLSLRQHVLEDVFVGWCLAHADSAVKRVDLSRGVRARRTALEPQQGVYVRHPLGPEELRLFHSQNATARGLPNG